MEWPDLAAPTRVTLADPAPFLRRLASVEPFHWNLDDADTLEMWALVAAAALTRRERAETQRSDVYHRGASNAARFAHAVGFDAARDGAPSPTAEVGRTVPIQRVADAAAIERSARSIAGAAVPAESESESRDALAYVIVELLRNVLQHSADPLGGVVGAQRMAAGRGGYTRDAVQVAVADNGRGVLESLRRFHHVADAEAALEKALRAHVSGVFPEGQTGGADNAGLGLFFTSEMVKLTAGRFLFASRGAALFIDGDEHRGAHRVSFLEPKGVGYPGTLAVFELPIEIVDRDALMETIRNRATVQTPRNGARRWLTFDPAPTNVPTFEVRDVIENTPAARQIAERMRVELGNGRPIALDFAGVRVATQSFLHTLLFQPLRVAWAMGAPIFVVNVEPAVRSALEYLESYAFG